MRIVRTKLCQPHEIVVNCLLIDNITNSPARKIPKSILSDQKQKEIKLWESFFAQYDK